MSRKVDGAGRVVIPKSLRDELGLEEGVEVEFDVEDGHLILKPVRASSPMIREQGVLMHRGKPTGGLERAVKEHRNRRVSDIGGRA